MHKLTMPAGMRVSRSLLASVPPLIQHTLLLHCTPGRPTVGQGVPVHHGSSLPCPKVPPISARLHKCTSLQCTVLLGHPPLG